MTILEKIAKIKKDTQKVYDVGFASGFEKGLNSTTLTISDITITFGKGQTWAEFSVDRTYCPVGMFDTSEGYVRYYGWEYVVNFDTGERVLATELIDENTNYYFSTPG